MKAKEEFMRDADNALEKRNCSNSESKRFR